MSGMDWDKEIEVNEGKKPTFLVSLKKMVE
jgi:hypothetical protein